MQKQLRQMFKVTTVLMYTEINTTNKIKMYSLNHFHIWNFEYIFIILLQYLWIKSKPLILEYPK